MPRSWFQQPDVERGCQVDPKVNFQETLNQKLETLNNLRTLLRPKEKGRTCNQGPVIGHAGLLRHDQQHAAGHGLAQLLEKVARQVRGAPLVVCRRSLVDCFRKSSFKAVLKSFWGTHLLSAGAGIFLLSIYNVSKLSKWGKSFSRYYWLSVAEHFSTKQC